ncbi:MAG: MFS transporter [Acidipropionibacterium sp.]|jgi:DHA1 family tetracycline resistance protein-like MFS transporter|nr:MFS transporter [Acidipropionibacterium sp.]
MTQTMNNDHPADPAPRELATGRTPPSRRAWLMLAAITFLNSIGMTIVVPVLPFITLKYIPDQASLGLWVGVLEAVYALCAFLVAPLLGGLSDRYGRRPVLIYSVFGAAAGYVLFGLGGSLWMLIAARAIQGLASGDMPALFGYVADITEPEDRAKRFGFLGALTGVAFMVGPALGGFLARLSLSAPVYVTAAVSVLVGLVSLFALPESLASHNRAGRMRLVDLNPVKVLGDAFRRPELRPILAGMALITAPFIFFASNCSVLALDVSGWGPTQVGLLLTVNGVLDVVIQGGLLALLLPRIGERGVVMAGALTQLAGCLGLAIAASLLPLSGLLASAILVFAAGQGGMTAALDGLMSRRRGRRRAGLAGRGLVLAELRHPGGDPAALRLVLQHPGARRPVLAGGGDDPGGGGDARPGDAP